VAARCFRGHSDSGVHRLPPPLIAHGENLPQSGCRVAVCARRSAAASGPCRINRVEVEARITLSPSSKHRASVSAVYWVASRCRWCRATAGVPNEPIAWGRTSYAKHVPREAARQTGVRSFPHLDGCGVSSGRDVGLKLWVAFPKSWRAAATQRYSVVSSRSLRTARRFWSDNYRLCAVSRRSPRSVSGRALVVRSNGFIPRGMRGSVGDSYRRESSRKTTVRETNGYRHSICIRTDTDVLSVLGLLSVDVIVEPMSSGRPLSLLHLLATARRRTSPARRGIASASDPGDDGVGINDFFVCNSGRCSASLDVRDCREGYSDFPRLGGYTEVRDSRCVRRAPRKNSLIFEATSMRYARSANTS